MLKSINEYLERTDALEVKNVCNTTWGYAEDEDTGVSGRMKLAFDRLDVRDYPLIVRDDDVTDDYVILVYKGNHNPGVGYEVHKDGKINLIAFYEDSKTKELYINVNCEVMDVANPLKCTGGEYPQVNIATLGTIWRHMVVAFAFGLYDGTSSHYYTINHKDFNIYNNDISNLELVSNVDNQVHAKICRAAARYEISIPPFSALGCSKRRYFNSHSKKDVVAFLADLFKDGGNR